MTKNDRTGASGIFWITFILLGLLILVGIFYWMVKKPNPVPHSPERPNGAIWSEPMPSARARIQPLARKDAAEYAHVGEV